jgi:hypothetical protein
VRVVQLPPAMLHVALVPEFRRRRRTPQLDEGGVCAIAKFDQLRVDAGTLQDPYSLRHRSSSILHRAPVSWRAPVFRNTP